MSKISLIIWILIISAVTFFAVIEYVISGATPFSIIFTFVDVLLIIVFVVKLVKKGKKKRLILQNSQIDTSKINDEYAGYQWYEINGIYIFARSESEAQEKWQNRKTEKNLTGYGHQIDKALHHKLYLGVEEIKPIAFQLIDILKGEDFERFIADVLRRNGYTDVRVTPATNDQGVDITATLNNERYAFQCKRYSNKLGNTPIQEVYTGKEFYKCTHAVVVTNNYFTKDAIKLARTTGVELWDRDILKGLLQNYFYE